MRADLRGGTYPLTGNALEPDRPQSKRKHWPSDTLDTEPLQKQQVPSVCTRSRSRSRWHRGLFMSLAPTQSFLLLHFRSHVSYNTATTSPDVNIQSSLDLSFPSFIDNTRLIYLPVSPLQDSRKHG